MRGTLQCTSQSVTVLSGGVLRIKNKPRGILPDEWTGVDTLEESYESFERAEELFVRHRSSQQQATVYSLGPWKFPPAERETQRIASRSK